MKKSIITAIVVIAIIASIFYLESTKTVQQSGEVQEISVQDTLVPENVSQEVLSARDVRIKEKALRYHRAIELVSPDSYINTESLALADHIGKEVILVDFWTYSCINCQRTLPYLATWDEKYKDDGLLIIGVHTPEFEFEKEKANVERAVEKYGVKYPVVQDNQRQTWSAYKNRYWPRKYLIDIDGFIVYDHIGEGAYEETELKIQELLTERAKTLGLDAMQVHVIGAENTTAVDFNKIRSPEIYFGYEFERDQMGNDEGWQPGKIVTYAAPDEYEKNIFYLDGQFRNNPGDMEVVSEQGKVYFLYNAKNVYVVAGASTPTNVTVLLDGVVHDTVTVGPQDLYTLVMGKEYGQHSLELHAPSGVRFYTFTFG